MVVSLWVRWRFLEIPLDRDEGEYAYIAQQMLRGVPPYESGYAMKMPGIYVAYAFGMLIFGETIRGVHAGVTAVTLASTALVFLLARKLFSPWIGAAAAGMFALLSLDSAMHGFAAQSEHFVLLPVLAGLWILVTVYATSDAAPAWWQLLLAGLCFGTAVMVKQHGFPFGVFAAWYVSYSWWIRPPRQWRVLALQLSALAVGALIPFVCVLVAMWLAGVFDQFWFWTITYARDYATLYPFSLGMQRLQKIGTSVVRSYPLIWATAAVGVLSTLWMKEFRARLPFLLPLLLLSFWGVSLGFYFREHYFLLLLPAVAILAGCGCDAVVRATAQWFLPRGQTEQPWGTLAVAGLLLGLGVFTHRDYLLRATPLQVSRMTYGQNPFPESIAVAQELARRMASDDSLLVFGSEPQIYFYLGRRAASPHIYAYPLMESHRFALEMQHDLAAQIEHKRPEWVVYSRTNASWLYNEASNPWIINWGEEQFDRDYERVGVVDIYSDATFYRWDADAATYEAKSPIHLVIYRRKPAPRPAAAANETQLGTVASL
jgi:MFS family permease